MKVTACSCDEAAHLRKALARVVEIATTNTRRQVTDDLAACANVADSALKLEPLPKPGDDEIYAATQPASSPEGPTRG